tara:strand:- start:808 stop:1245 length:438 start_codon:yes stop_codon:yes gene_type:complete
MPIQAVRVQDCWEVISPEIDSIMEDLPWKDFRKEDLYAACVGGNAAIFIDTDFPLGESFFVARIDENSSTGEKVLFLWIAHSKANETADRVHNVIADIAANSGCSAVEFITGNESVMDHGRLYGFEKVMYRCRREVAPGQQVPDA